MTTKLFIAIIVAITLLPLLGVRCTTSDSPPCTWRDLGFNQGQVCD